MSDIAGESLIADHLSLERLIAGGRVTRNPGLAFPALGSSLTHATKAKL